MSDLIDREKLLNSVEAFCEWCDNHDFCPTCETNDCIQEIKNAPTVDAVTVVRCKDCRYCTDCKYGDAYCMMNMIWYKEDHYCSDGIRKERRNE